jgi:GNAT superfamily N-acetyltransferase
VRITRLIEVADADMLEWDTGRPVPEPTARVATEVVRVDAQAPERGREVLPADLHGWAERFLDLSDVGYLAVAGGEFGGWVWLRQRTHRDSAGLTVRLAPDEGYAHSLWVPEQLRPAGVASVLVAAMLAGVRDEGRLRRVYGWVDRENRPSALLFRMIFGFSDVQKVKRFEVAYRWGGQVPFSARPRYGPLSRRGRHAEVSAGAAG